MTFVKDVRDRSGTTQNTPEDRNIIYVFQRDPVPKAPRAPADFGASGEASSSRSRIRPRCRPRTTASCDASPEDQRSAALRAAYSELVRHYRLRYDVWTNVVHELELENPDKASVFLDHTPEDQMELILNKINGARCLVISGFFKEDFLEFCLGLGLF